MAYYKHFMEYLATSSGGVSGALDCSTGSTDSLGERDMTLTPSTDTTYLVRQLVAAITDSSGFALNKYGSVSSTGITDGVTVSVKGSTGNTIYTLSSTKSTIKKNQDWAELAGDRYALHSGGSTGPWTAVARLQFAGDGVPLRGADGEYLAVTLDDDFSGLDGHKFVAYGLEGVTGKSYDGVQPV